MPPPTYRRDSGYARRDRSRSPDRRGGASYNGTESRRTDSNYNRDRPSYRDRDRGGKERQHEYGSSKDTKEKFEFGDSQVSVRPSEDMSLNINRKEDEPPVPVEPNFKNSGLLAAETNTVNGVVLKYNEPADSRKPTRKWRLYVYKKDKQVDMVILQQSAYLFGRDEKVVDVHIKHESASKQHAVVQFRAKKEKNEFGDVTMNVVPYLIDLDSSNGTSVNGEKIPKSRFYELMTGDVLKFAYSTREYVLLEEP